MEPLNSKTLLQLINGRSCQTVEIVQRVSLKRLAATVSAFANGKGGYIVFEERNGNKGKERKTNGGNRGRLINDLQRQFAPDLPKLVVSKTTCSIRRMRIWWISVFPADMCIRLRDKTWYYRDGSNNIRYGDSVVPRNTNRPLQLHSRGTVRFEPSVDKRDSAATQASAKSTWFGDGPLRIDAARYQVRFKDVIYSDLKPAEFRLFKYFYEIHNRRTTKGQYRAVKDVVRDLDLIVEPGAVANHISKINMQIKRLFGRGVLIHGVRGRGYLLLVGPEAVAAWGNRERRSRDRLRGMQMIDIEKRTKKDSAEKAP